MFTAAEQKFMINLARNSIEHFLKHGAAPAVDSADIPKELREKLSCFVTLTIDGRLRGCIGHIESIQPLYLDIIENAASAAFEDARFGPLTAVEFEKIKIEVSVLTKPSPLDFFSPDDLEKKLRPNIDGVIIKKGVKGATYLPQVWEELPDKKEFLSSLCLKAGLDADDWTRPGLSVWTYQAEIAR